MNWKRKILWKQLHKLIFFTEINFNRPFQLCYTTIQYINGNLPLAPSVQIMTTYTTINEQKMCRQYVYNHNMPHWIFHFSGIFNPCPCSSQCMHDIQGDIVYIFTVMTCAMKCFRHSSVSSYTQQILNWTG